MFGTDLPLGAADEASFVAVQVDSVRLHEEEVLVGLVQRNLLKYRKHENTLKICEEISHRNHYFALLLSS